MNSDWRRDVLLLCRFRSRCGLGGFPFFPFFAFFALAGERFLCGLLCVDVGLVQSALVGIALRLVLRAGAAADGHHDAPAGGRDSVQIDGL